jgi:hypothetical protein
METGKTSKYLKYAIGEIILVVIGILIALQINNWNEIKKMNQEEVTILQSLKNDLIADLKSYNISIERLQMRAKFTKNVLALLKSPPTNTIDSVETSRKLLTIGWIENFSPSFATYEEIKGSGKLSILKSDTIKLELANYKSMVDYSSTIYVNWNEDIKDYERLITSHFEGDIAQQFLMSPAPLSNKSLMFSLEKISQDKKLVKLLKYISYLTKMEINGKKHALIPKIESIVSLIDKDFEQTK